MHACTNASALMITSLFFCSVPVQALVYLRLTGASSSDCLSPTYRREHSSPLHVQLQSPINSSPGCSRCMSAAAQNRVTVRYFDDGSRESVPRADISTVEGSATDSGNSSSLELSVGCFVKIRGRDAVVIPGNAAASPPGSGSSGHAMPSTGSPSFRKRPRELNTG